MKSISRRRTLAARNFIEAIAKAFAVLEVLGKSPKGMTLQELTESLEMVKSSVFRLLFTLERLGYVRKSEQKYRLGFRSIELGKMAVGHYELHEIALPYMEDLRRTFGETVNLGVVESNEVLYVEVLESPHAFRLAGRAGDRNPLHTSALGKSHLAFMPEEDVKKIVAATGLKGRSPYSITSHRALKKDLELIRSRGYAVDNEEDSVGTRCVGAPIFGSNNRPIAAISISAPAIRLSAAKDSGVAASLLEACQEISRQFGYNAPEHSSASVLKDERNRR